MAEYYKLNTRRITLKEYWNIRPSPKVLIPWLGAKLGLRMGTGTSFRRPAMVKEMEVSAEGFSSTARQVLQPVLDQCLSLSFHTPRYFVLETLRQHGRTSSINMLHVSGQFSVRLTHTIMSTISPPIQSTGVYVLSELRDGSWLCTTDQKPKFLSMPGVFVQRLIGANVSQLVAAHRQKIAELPIANPVKTASSQEEMDAVWDRYERASFDFGIKRGLYVPMSPEEVAAEHRIVDTAKAMATGTNPEYADVLVQLSALQNRQSGWRSALPILIVSLLLFALAGSSGRSSAYLLILIPVVLVHELGHFIAMRAFHYRNLRMFFIPFFGAAVSGSHFNVPGWKKVIVSLMGPVPGVLLGGLLGGVGVALHNAVLIKAAIVALILNGFNLLPVLPLDGGWVVHSLLFCRHHMLDTAFRVVAVMGLFGLGILTHSKVLSYLAIFMSIGIRVSFRMARIANELRKRGLPPVSPDDQNIPPETANAIIAEVKKIMPGKHSNKLVGQQTLQIFETLNARPPGWAATIGLLSVHLGSLGLAAAFLFAVRAAQVDPFLQRFSEATRTPARAFTCGAIYSWQGAQANAGLRAAPLTIIAHFAGEEPARRCFDRFTNEVPASAVLEKVGHSLFLTLPAGNPGLGRQWTAKFKRETRYTITASTNAPALLSLSVRFPTPEQAKAVETELDEYFSSGGTTALIPPWFPHDPRTDEQRAVHRLARQTYLKAIMANQSDDEDAGTADLREQIRAAYRKQDQPEAARLRAQLQQRQSDQLRQRLSQLKTNAPGQVDPIVIDLYAAYAAQYLSTNRLELEDRSSALFDRLGRPPQLDGAFDDRFSIDNALVTRNEATVEFRLASVKRPADAIPTLFEWLCRQGEVSLKYELSASLFLNSSQAE